MSEKRIYELTAQNTLNSDDYLAVDKPGNATAKKVPASVIVDQFADMNNILGAKNLLPNNAVTVVLRGITWTINSDGTITANGTATGGDSTLYYVSSTNDSTVGITIPAGKYTYSCLTTEGSDSTFRSEIYNLTNPSRIGWDYGEGVTFTRSADTKVLGSINIRSGATVSNITFKPMLRPAAVDNSYVPFAKTNKQLTEDVTQLNSDLGKLKETESGEVTLTVGATALSPAMFASTSITFTETYSKPPIVITDVDSSAPGTNGSEVSQITTTGCKIGGWRYGNNVSNFIIRYRVFEVI